VAEKVMEVIASESGGVMVAVSEQNARKLPLHNSFANLFPRLGASKIVDKMLKHRLRTAIIKPNQIVHPVSDDRLSR
jgi:hypothetical protein